MEMAGDEGKGEVSSSCPPGSGMWAETGQKSGQIYNHTGRLVRNACGPVLQRALDGGPHVACRF